MRSTSPVRDDRIGKPFLVVDQNTRCCLVCDRLFSRQEARKHAQIACSADKPVITEGAIRLPPSWIGPVA
jgi:hypothetical protein